MIFDHPHPPCRLGALAAEGLVAPLGAPIARFCSCVGSAGSGVCVRWAATSAVMVGIGLPPGVVTGRGREVLFWVRDACCAALWFFLACCQL